MHEVTIVGGGPAGSVAALALARRGWRVTLIEQHEFPREKVCGECISALGLQVLSRLGAQRALLEHHPAILTHSLLHASDGACARVPLRTPMWGLSRAKMDSTLLDLAREERVTVRQPVRCESIEPGARPTVRVRDLVTNRADCWQTDWVLLADGKAALLPNRPRRTNDFGIKSHFQQLDGPRDAIELFGVDGHYGGIAPIEDGRWNIAFSVPAALLERYHGNLDALFAFIVSQNQSLSRRFIRAQQTGPWLAAPLPRFPVSWDWPQGVIPVGNAAAALEPIGGEGMGLAMRSAELAAGYLDCLTHAKVPLPVADLQRQFDRLWRLRRTACRAAAKIVSHPILAGPSIDWLAADEQLAAFAFRMIGKS